MHEVVCRRPRVERLLQGVEGQVAAQRARNPPANDRAGEHVDDEGDVDEPRPGGDVGQVRHPELVRALRPELALHQVWRAHGLEIRLRRHAVGPASDRPTQAAHAHQAFHRAAGHVHALSTQLPPDLLHPVHREVLVPDPADLIPQRLVPLRAFGPPIGIPAPSPALVVG